MSRCSTGPGIHPPLESEAMLMWERCSTSSSSCACLAATSLACSSALVASAFSRSACSLSSEATYASWSSLLALQWWYGQTLVNSFNFQHDNLDIMDDSKISTENIFSVFNQSLLIQSLQYNAAMRNKEQHEIYSISIESCAHQHQHEHLSTVRHHNQQISWPLLHNNRDDRFTESAQLAHSVTDTGDCVLTSPPRPSHSTPCRHLDQWISAAWILANTALLQGHYQAFVRRGSVRSLTKAAA